MASYSRTAEAGIYNILGTGLFFTVISIVVFYGWVTDLEDYITAEEGLGYYLGVFGGCLMLLLMLYPLRKRVRWLHGFGTVSSWFRMHMLCGIIGPVLILYHCNFHLGSANSNVALICMLIVAASGLAGRYFYKRIHYGLYGSKASLESLKEDVRETMEEIISDLEFVPKFKKRLLKYENEVLNAGPEFFASMARMIRLEITTRWMDIAGSSLLFKYIFLGRERRTTGFLNKYRLYHNSVLHLSRNLLYIRKIAGYAFYERMFSIWHILHIPLFIMLLVSGVIHVISVHIF